MTITDIEKYIDTIDPQDSPLNSRPFSVLPKHHKLSIYEVAQIAVTQPNWQEICRDSGFPTLDLLARSNNEPSEVHRIATAEARDLGDYQTIGSTNLTKAALVKQGHLAADNTIFNKKALKLVVSFPIDKPPITVPVVKTSEIMGLASKTSRFMDIKVAAERNKNKYKDKSAFIGLNTYIPNIAG